MLVSGTGVFSRYSLCVNSVCRSTDKVRQQEVKRDGPCPACRWSFPFSMQPNLPCQAQYRDRHESRGPATEPRRIRIFFSCFHTAGVTSNRHTTDTLTFLFLSSVASVKARLSFHSKEKDHDQEKTASHRMPLAPQLYEKMHRLRTRPGG